MIYRVYNNYNLMRQSIWRQLATTLQAAEEDTPPHYQCCCSIINQIISSCVHPPPCEIQVNNYHHQMQKRTLHHCDWFWGVEKGVGTAIMEGLSTLGHDRLYYANKRGKKAGFAFQLWLMKNLQEFWRQNKFSWVWKLKKLNFWAFLGAKIKKSVKNLAPKFENSPKLVEKF